MRLLGVEVLAPVRFAVLVGLQGLSVLRLGLDILVLGDVGGDFFSHG